MKTPKQEFEQIIKAFEITLFFILLFFFYVVNFMLIHKFKIFVLILIGGLFGGLAFAYWL
jgi:hypothetical protein